MRAWISDTTAPACRMRSISRPFLIVTAIGSCRLLTSRGPRDRSEDIVRDVFDRPITVHLHELAALAVKVEQRRGLLIVQGEPSPDRLRSVIFALDQPASVAITHARHIRRVEDDVVRRSA